MKGLIGKKVRCCNEGDESKEGSEMKSEAAFDVS